MKALKYNTCRRIPSYGLLLGLLFVFLGAHVCFSADIGPIPRETVTSRVTAQNGFAWNYGYDIELKNSTVLVHVAINLIPAGGVTKPELDRVNYAWEKGVERIWSRRFSLVTPLGQEYPIIFDITFKGSRFHHEVIVRPGSGRSDELNWNLLDTPVIVAHEFGHIVGTFDEYKRGATAPHGEVIDTTSIMTSNPTGGTTYARHYKVFRAWFIDKTGLRDVSLLPIDGRIQEMSAKIEKVNITRKSGAF